MTVQQIKRYYATRYKDMGERLIDVYIYGENLVDLITITNNHVIFRTTYRIDEKRLEFVRTKLLT